jgi:hypothetical protein
MDRVAAHYTDAFSKTGTKLPASKDALRNWQMAKQHQSQRISEVIELCVKRSAAARLTDPQPSPSAVSALPDF